PGPRPGCSCPSRNPRRWRSGWTWRSLQLRPPGDVTATPPEGRNRRRSRCLSALGAYSLAPSAAVPNKPRSIRGTLMQGLMQDWPLTVDRILNHARDWHGNREVGSRSVEGPVVRTTYAEIHERARRVSNALKAWGVKPGDRIGTLAWNTGRHMEAWYGIMGIGAVCHTLNPLLFPEQLAYIINHSEDRVLFTDLTLVPLLDAVLPHYTKVERVVVMTDEWSMPQSKLPQAECYEQVLAEQSADCQWGGLDENAACGLCYTSGTTGDPKGVLYSHRSNFLHTLITLQADV